MGRWDGIEHNVTALTYSIMTGHWPWPTTSMSKSISWVWQWAWPCHELTYCIWRTTVDPLAHGSNISELTTGIPEKQEQWKKNLTSNETMPSVNIYVYNYIWITDFTIIFIINITIFIAIDKLCIDSDKLCMDIVNYLFLSKKTFIEICKLFIGVVKLFIVPKYVCNLH